MSSVAHQSRRDHWNRLIQTMEELRSDHGCPWDREQTHETLTPYLIEETYEVLETIQDGNWDRLKEELGDLLLQIVFHAQLAREAGYFTISDVVSGITQKLRRRHPHVFEHKVPISTKAVLTQWDEIKEKEKKRNGPFEGIPRGLPGLLRAQKLQSRASSLGFAWPDIGAALAKVKEELAEVEDALEAGDVAHQSEELGDLFFVLVNLCQWLSLDAETAVQGTCEKFCRRFAHVYDKAQTSGRSLREMTLAEMEAIWNESKADSKEG
ncbi:MAG: nucleoside triphosphate pyrophosphohydrolase [Armatimonadetes bacterium]|nr:nucleoside triphosphate pyrophosphohydrolase [Armatimonadota bacterium]